MTVRGILLLMVFAGGLAAGAQTQPPTAPAEVNPPRVPKDSTSVAPVKVKAGDDAGEKGEAPLNTAPLEPPVDASLASSPVSPERVGPYLRPGTKLQVHLNRAIDSGKDHNGEAVDGTLLDAVTVSTGKVLPAGTPVLATVLSAAPAGKVTSAGVLTLQIDRVGPVAIITNVLSFEGRQGPKVLADSAPAKGTEAGVGVDTILPFQVMGAGNVPLEKPGDGNETGGGRSGRSGRPAGARGVENGAAAPGTSPASGTQSAAPGATTPH